MKVEADFVTVFFLEKGDVDGPALNLDEVDVHINHIRDEPHDIPAGVQFKQAVLDLMWSMMRLVGSNTRSSMTCSEKNVSRSCPSHRGR